MTKPTFCTTFNRKKIKKFLKHIIRDMEDFIDDFFNEIEEENKQFEEAEKRKNFFKNIGKLGGRKTKSGKVFDKIIVVRFNSSDVEILRSKAKKSKISLSKYIRLASLEKELKINEFLLDSQLIYFGNSFKRLSNFIKNSGFSELENRQKLLNDVELLVREIREYLYNRLIVQENDE